MGNQDAKFDTGKAQLTLVPTKIIFDIARIREYGVKKYKDPENWKRVEIERYRDALYRHWLAYINDPHGVDEESGMPHLWHVACNCAFLCEMETYDRKENLESVNINGRKQYSLPVTEEEFKALKELLSTTGKIVDVEPIDNLLRRLEHVEL